VLCLLGVAMLFPAVQHLLERPFQRLRIGRVDTRRGGFALGVALGAVYVPCAGPVLAVISVAGATGHIGWRTVALTVAFGVGAAAPLLGFALAGRQVAERVQAFRKRQRLVRVVAGLTLIALAVALTFNVTDALQRSVPDYTAALNRALDNDRAAQALSPKASGLLANCVDSHSSQLADCGVAPALTGIQQWLGSPDGKAPVTAGKVVLVDFWAYSCINCQRAIPHVEAWYRNYAAAGLVVIGVHTPEYAFEHVPGNVAAGARRLGITYPVAIDDNDATWTAFHNKVWPADFLIDASGRVRHVDEGEGDYGSTESLIRELLAATHPGSTLPPATDISDATPVNPLQTPETYLGYGRQKAFVDGGLQPGQRAYRYPASLPLNKFALTGTWTITAEELTAGPGAGIELSYDAADVYLDVGGTGSVAAAGGDTFEELGPSTALRVAGVPNIYTVAHATDVHPAVVRLQVAPGLQLYSFSFG
jgi:thiol-disulfide isomerase/thioredoxin